MAIRQENKVHNLTAAETWQHQYIAINGIRLHYVIQGKGPLIVLMHGFPEFWYSWRYQIPFLAEHGYTVVAPDLRGYNETDRPRNGYDIPTLLRDIEGLIKDLGQQKASIVGHDWGGVLAWTFAINYPAMTESLIVMNAPHPAAMMREMRTLNSCAKAGMCLLSRYRGYPNMCLAEITRTKSGECFEERHFKSRHLCLK